MRAAEEIVATPPMTVKLVMDGAPGNLLDRQSYYQSPAASPCGNQTGNNGNMYSIVDNVNVGWTQGFTYDSLNRLTSAGRSDGGYSHTHNYDSFGNLTVQDNLNPNPNWGIDSATNALLRNPIAGVVGTCGRPLNDYIYDCAGNMISSGPAGHSYTYNALNQILSVDGGATASYEYNTSDERSVKWTPTGWTSYIYLNGQPMAEQDQNGWTDYIYANGQKIAKIASPATGSPVTTYYVDDHLGTTQMELDASGNVLWQGQFTPFGAELPDGNTSMHYKFTGKERDAESGLDYFGARYYASNMARWISPDEVNLTEERMLNPSSTLNKYAYAANNPLTYVDPDGEDITIFFENGIPGHTMMLAFDPSLPRAAYRSFGPDHGSPGWWLAAISIPVPGTDQFGFDQLKTADAIRQKFAIITLKTSPETTQKVVQELLTHPDGKYITLGTNCTTSCLKVIAKIKGLTPGNNPLIPYDYFSQLYLTNGNGTAANRNNGPVFQPGNNYGRYTPVWDPFSILDRLINSQKPPGDDANGPHPAYPCNGCPKFD
jgi:RHS repeat-associated protein